jgi:hypothetical protein
MTEPLVDDRRPLRRCVYLLLIALASGQMIGRIVAVNSVNLEALAAARINELVAKKAESLVEQRLEQTEIDRRLEEHRASLENSLRFQRPFLSGNDRSRWCMIRALVEQGTYRIDSVTSEPGWDTIDMVQHKGRDGRWHLYSSKPPLFPTLMAGQYWLIHKTTGWTLADHPYEIGRIMLVANNVPPMIVFFILVAAMMERYALSDWSRLFVVAVATLGTFLSTFAIVLNNHLQAAVCATVVLYGVLRIWIDGEARRRYFALVGLFAALTVANELPSASLFGAVLVGLGYYYPRQTLVAFAPAALLVVAASFGTNYLAHERWLPPYANRRPGDELFALENRLAANLKQGVLPAAEAKKFAEHDAPLPYSRTIEPTPNKPADTAWTIYAERRYRVVLNGGQFVVSRDFGSAYLPDERPSEPPLLEIPTDNSLADASSPEAVEWQESLDKRNLPEGLRKQLAERQVELPEDAIVAVEQRGQEWLVVDPLGAEKYSINLRGDQLAVDAWGDWYNYKFWRDGRLRDSYWRDRRGIDAGEKRVGDYALHVLVGHHGVFSLTPVWLLSLAGVALMIVRPATNRRGVGLLILSVSTVCLGFYIAARPLADRNYGGMTSAFRWSFWMTPLWLFAMTPILDSLAHRRAWRIFAAILLCLSAMSAAYPTWNPWTHPWLMKFFLYMDWVQ